MWRGGFLNVDAWFKRMVGRDAVRMVPRERDEGTRDLGFPRGRNKGVSESSGWSVAIRTGSCWYGGSWFRGGWEDSVRIAVVPG